MVILEEHLVPNGVDAIRISDYAYKHFKIITTRKGMKKAIDNGEVYVDGEEVETAHWVKTGQRISLIDKGGKTPKEYHMKLEVVYEDEYLAVINKPAGIVVSGNQFRCVENTLSYNLNPSKLLDALKWPKPCHRLDSQTSGLLIVAKTKGALVSIGEQFKDRTIKKKYVTVVAGRCNELGTIDTPINNLKACTKFKKISVVNSLKNEHLSLVEVEPVTGRTHQIRIHLASIGHPIIGDKLYGEEGSVLKHKGLFLASIEIGFAHPKNGQDMKCNLDHPKKFDTWLKYEQKRWANANP